MKTDESSQRDRMFLKLFLTSSPTELTDEEVAYFHDNPDLIEEVTAPVNVHKRFLWGGALLGTLFVSLSKVIKFAHGSFFSEAVLEFVVDINFEIGVALIGAAVTAYILGILLNKQQENAAHWRSEIRRRIRLLQS